jgi:hypothetical protein
MPLLQVTEPEDASLILKISTGQTRILNLIGIVSPYSKRENSAFYHLTQSDNSKKVLGGLSIW